MSDSQPQRAKVLFEQILDLRPDEHDAFLKEACGSDRALEAEVRSLVEAHREAGGFLEGGDASTGEGEAPSGMAAPLRRTLL